MVLLIAVMVECMLIDAAFKYKIGMASTYIAIGMVIQYIIHLFYFAIDVRFDSGNVIDLLLRMFSFLLCQSLVIVSLCKMFGNRKVRLASLSGDILAVLVSYSIIETFICNIIMRNAINVESVYCYIAIFL